LFSRIRSAARTARGKATAIGAIGATVVLAASLSAGVASAQAAPSGNAIPLGDGYMGVGYLQDGKSFAPDTRQLPLGAGSAVVTPFATTVPGVDVSHYQGTINWASVRSAGIQFAYIKATEGTTYKDPMFNTDYLGAYNNGVIRGAYHFARPDLSTGAAQATYFAGSGGAWSTPARAGGTRAPAAGAACPPEARCSWPTGPPRRARTFPAASRTGPCGSTPTPVL
jgi:hypothetical protein